MNKNYDCLVGQITSASDKIDKSSAGLCVCVLN